MACLRGGQRPPGHSRRGPFSKKTFDAAKAGHARLMSSIKLNQRALHAKARGAFAELDAGFCEGASSASEVFKEKGFVVEKRYDALPLSKRMARHMAAWRSRVATVARVLRTRDDAKGQRVEEQFYGFSAPTTALEAKAAIEGHWQVENQLHQRLDRALGEDSARASKFAKASAMLSMAAHNLLRMNMAPGVARGWKEMIVANAAKPYDLFAWKGISS